MKHNRNLLINYYCPLLSAKTHLKRCTARDLCKFSRLFPIQTNWFVIIIIAFLLLIVAQNNAHLLRLLHRPPCNYLNKCLPHLQLSYGDAVANCRLRSFAANAIVYCDYYLVIILSVYNRHIQLISLQIVKAHKLELN